MLIFTTIFDWRIYESIPQKYMLHLNVYWHQQLPQQLGLDLYHKQIWSELVFCVFLNTGKLKFFIHSNV